MSRSIRPMRAFASRVLRRRTAASITVLLSVLVVVLALSSARTSAAVTYFCGDASSDFGTECSLAEMYVFGAGIQIDQAFFGEVEYDEDGSFAIDSPAAHRVRVVPVGAGTSRPGLRFEAPPDVWSEVMLDAAGGRNLMEFVITFVAHAVPGTPPISVVGTSFDIQALVTSIVDASGAGLTPGTSAFGTIDVDGDFQPQVANRLWLVPTPVFQRPPHDEIFFAAPHQIIHVRHRFNLDRRNDPELDDPGRIVAYEHRILLAGTPPPPPPSAIASIIQNGLFGIGLGGWTCIGPGTCTIVNTASGLPAAELTTDGTPTTISQLIDTPRSTFAIDFDYQFTTTAGSLEVVLIDGGVETVVGSLNPPSPVQPVFSHAHIVVNDPALLGRTGVELVFRLQPGSVSGVEIANVRIPVTLLPLPTATASYVFTHDDHQQKEEWSDSAADTVSAQIDAQMELTNANGDADASVQAFAAATLGLSGTIELKDATVLEGYNPLMSGSSFAEAQGVNRYRIAGPAGTPVDVDIPVTIGGDLEIHNVFWDPSSVKVSVDVTVSTVHERRHWHGLSFLSRDLSTGSGLPALDTDAYWLVGETLGTTGLHEGYREEVAPELYWYPLDWLPVAPVDPFGIRYRTAKVILLSDLIHGLPGEELAVEFRIRIECVEPQLKSTCVGDFSHTLSGSATTDTPGAQLIPLGGPGGGSGGAPTASAGADQVLEATSAGGSDVTLDGSGSSDPTGASLTYEWALGGQVIAMGATPTVTLPLGAHTVDLTVSNGTQSATDSVVVTVQDATPPMAQATAAPPPNANGWNNSDVTVSFSGSDVNGVSDPVACQPAASTLTADGAAQLVASVCSDQAGNGSIASIAISLDKTPPSISLMCPAQITQNDPATATIAVSDALSGIASQSYPNGSQPLDTAAVGEHLFSVDATDLAGNTTSANCSYTVQPAEDEGGGATLGDVLAFFDQSVANGTLDGVGALRAGRQARLAVYRSLLVVAVWVDAHDRPILACVSLHAAAELSDGVADPTDLITGSALAELNALLAEARSTIGCP
jgi:PKD domain